ncbi:hypothetical protein DN589_19635 [Klebsiella quasipneumoniae subsp. similipneumoniae]|nr:hypothetical protein DN589_19635 [Klebsiella quasipneumoniae subsp. similipneumoniae]
MILKSLCILGQPFTKFYLAVIIVTAQTFSLAPKNVIQITLKHAKDNVFHNKHLITSPERLKSVRPARRQRALPFYSQASHD